MTRPKSSPKVKIEENLREIDSIFEVAGLVRNRRTTPAGITTRLRHSRKDPAAKTS